MSMNTVLCAVDVSNEGQDGDVLRHAAGMAKTEGAQLDVITVVPDFGMSVVGGFFEPAHHEQALAEARKRMDALVTSILGPDGNKTVRHLVATGTTYKEILRVAEMDKADLIVIGAHKPDFTDYLLGPNAARVVRHATCSVYVVR